MLPDVFAGPVCNSSQQRGRQGGRGSIRKREGGREKIKPETLVARERVEEGEPIAAAFPSLKRLGAGRGAQAVAPRQTDIFLEYLESRRGTEDDDEDTDDGHNDDANDDANDDTRGEEKNKMRMINE